MAKQINVFLENRPGRIESITEVIGKNKINVWAFTIQDRGDFGLMKLLVDKPQKAYLLLADKGYACALKDVIVVLVKDKPGNLHTLSALLLKNKVNIVDAHGYVMFSSKEGICTLDLNVRDTKKIQGILTKAGFKILDDEDLAAYR